MESCLHLNGVLWHCVISACTNDFLLFFFFPTFPLFSHSFHVLYCYLHTFLWISLLTVAALAFSLAATAQAPRIITGPAPVLPPAALRTPTPAGPTIMPLIRQIQTAVMPNGTPHPTAAIVPPGPEAGLIYTPYEYPYTLAPATSILEYPIEPSGVLGKTLICTWLENTLHMLSWYLHIEVMGLKRKKKKKEAIFLPQRHQNCLGKLFQWCNSNILTCFALWNVFSVSVRLLKTKS